MKAIISSFVLVCSACGHEALPPSTPRATVAQQPPATAPIDSKSPTRGVVHLSQDIQDACNLRDADAHFAFDSASLQETERPALTKLVACFVSGPLAGKEMRLVGHADPRGGDDYNMVLGGSRADTVKAFLEMRGLPGARMATSSRGELDARGTDERSWAEDRRVDIMAH
ncbi:MAG TPA: OmpA family protein [Polyangiaceae bacterium]|nr:OmpA family protein [Polyangiaceae bacterium]